MLVLALGSNQGNRAFFLKTALSELVKNFGKCLAQSPIYETEPWGVNHSTSYLNQVLVFFTDENPDEILILTQEIEKKFGREKKGDLSPRNLDIDILYLGHEIIQKPGMMVPHTRLIERKFVLQPLEDVLPDFIHPIFGERQQVLNQALPGTFWIKKYFRPEGGF